MNLDFNDEQVLLRDTVARFVQDNYSLEKRNAIIKSPGGFSAEHWRTMADLGWLSLPFSEADGGLGGTHIETMILMEQFGKGIVVEPFLAGIVLGGGALKRGASQSLKEELLPGVLDGSKQLTLAYAEAQARFDLECVATVAKAKGNDFVINGGKSFVLNAGTASHLIVAARTSGKERDVNGISLFVVDANATGISISAHQTYDGLQVSDVRFQNVTVAKSRVLGEVDKGFALLQSAINDGILAVSAEAVGVMDMLYKDTVAYTQQRVQFDRPLSEFQALQHRMVEMFMEYELARSLLYRATMLTAQDSPEAQRSIHALKYLIGRAGSFVGENAVQLHGGMGMTEELRIGHYFKRLLTIDLQFGNGDYHLRKFAG
jgi:alkylation response protein AidB-like acyl-CoA dehydrogenase